LSRPNSGFAVAGDAALGERGGEVFLDDQSAARAINQPDARFHLADRRLVDNAARRLGQRRVQRDEIGPRQQLIERDALDAQFERALGRQERVVGDDAHFEALCTVGDDRADIAAADDAERLAVKLDAHKARFLPFAGLGRAVGRRDFARQCEHHRDCVLGGGDRIAVGRVHDDDAARARRLDIDIVDADAGAADDAEAIGDGEQFGRDLGRRAHRQPVILADAVAQIGWSEANCDIGLDGARPENLHRPRAQRIGYQHLRHIQPQKAKSGNVKYAKATPRPRSPGSPGSARPLTPPLSPPAGRGSHGAAAAGEGE
jgi:hypothetical protein